MLHSILKRFRRHQTHLSSAHFETIRGCVGGELLRQGAAEFSFQSQVNIKTQHRKTDEELNIAFLYSSTQKQFLSLRIQSVLPTLTSAYGSVTEAAVLEAVRVVGRRLAALLFTSSCCITEITHIFIGDRRGDHDNVPSPNLDEPHQRHREVKQQLFSAKNPES